MSSKDVSVGLSILPAIMKKETIGDIKSPVVRLDSNQRPLSNR